MKVNRQKFVSYDPADFQDETLDKKAMDEQMERYAEICSVWSKKSVSDGVSET